MVQVVLSLDKEYDKKLRKLAKMLYGGRKGSMSEVVEMSLEVLEKKIKRDKAYKELLRLAENAKALGIGKFRREDAYAR
jgi:Arc/MetJ-type ribon-helix-helix transcriptional regulator